MSDDEDFGLEVKPLVEVLGQDLLYIHVPATLMQLLFGEGVLKQHGIRSFNCS